MILRRSIRISNKNLPKPDDGSSFFIMKTAVCAKAFNELTKTAFALFLYIYSYGREGCEFGLSQTHFLNTYKCSVPSYKKAFHELVDKGYLKENKKGYYDFDLKGEGV